MLPVSRVLAALLTPLLAVLVMPLAVAPSQAARLDDPPVLQPQTVTFTSQTPTDPRIGDHYDVSAEGGGSGNPVTFSLDTTSEAGACTVEQSPDQAPGQATVSLTGAGTCVIAADQAGNEEYDASPTATQSFTVRKRTQSLTVHSTPPATQYVGKDYVVNASPGETDHPVVISIDDASTTGACTVTGTRVTLRSPGTCLVDIDQEGDDVYEDAHVQQTIQAINRSQVIIFKTDPPTSPRVGTLYKVAAQGGASGNEVRFSVDRSTPGACTVSRIKAGSAKVVFTASGTCLVDALQDGATGYDPAVTQTQTIELGAMSQAVVITSKAPARPTVGQTYTVTARGGGSGNDVVFSLDESSQAGACSVDRLTATSATVSFTGRGACVIAADQAGNAHYSAAPQVRQSLAVVGAAQRITFTSPQQPRYVIGSTFLVTASGGSSQNPVVFSASASSAGVCTVSETGTVSFTGLGNCVVQADQDGSATTEPAPRATLTLPVTAATQTIVYDTAPPKQTSVGRTYTVAAHGGGSGTVVSYSIPTASAAVCTVDDHADGTATVTAVKAGKCTLRADQVGSPDGSYTAAPPVQVVTTVRSR